ncbi:MAG: hypothetical protein Q4G65_02560 [bacterium]|nr:hypothetical protein [bacterium]
MYFDSAAGGFWGVSLLGGGCLVVEESRWPGRIDVSRLVQA